MVKTKQSLEVTVNIVTQNVLQLSACPVVTRCRGSTCHVQVIVVVRKLFIFQNVLFSSALTMDAIRNVYTRNPTSDELLTFFCAHTNSMTTNESPCEKKSTASTRNILMYLLLDLCVSR
ncbi:hypothetical protein NPIL_352411 [Nephila pilipes]|uniref:Uncharacterized protein n=1 Tax=Nephila pilipes TaxID=299642 RepID=A0A8X6Q3A1_NEPPI|nr:hypothetical protein NPIL_352411 [Nephila pilipes]